MTNDPNGTSAGSKHVRSGPSAVVTKPGRVDGITTSPKFAANVSHQTEMAVHLFQKHKLVCLVEKSITSFKSI